MGWLLNFAQRQVNRAWERKHSKPTNSIIRGSRHPMHRAFAAAKQDRITASFTGTGLSPDEALRRDLRVIRKRARQLCMDNDYAKKFLHMVMANVIGNTGIRLQARTVWPDGALDTENNKIIEDAWRRWGVPGNCSVTTKLSWRDTQRLFTSTVARDGEVIVRMVDGASNDFKFALQMIEADHLDENYNARARNGNKIVMGIEIDGFGKPVAYHLSTRHPGDNSYLSGGRHFDRVPAADIIHAFICDRPGQNRGVPWFHTSARRLDMLGGYEEAELVAARIGASKMGFYTSPDGVGPTPDELGPDSTELNEYDLIEEAEPGVFQNLPDGVGFQTFDPQHPTSAFADFTKAVLRGASSGLNVAYNTLANDLEGVNFSSIRSGVLEEREQWRLLQGWVIEQFCMPVYSRWLRMALTTRQLDLPPNRIDKFRVVHWQPRGWAWVDPAKDASANSDKIATGTGTRSRALAAEGEDFEDTIEQLAYEQEFARERGVDITPISKQSTAEATNADNTNPPN